jgi:hypothetical protein
MPTETTFKHFSQQKAKGPIMTHDEISALQATLVQTQAQLTISKFPGLQLSLSDDGTYDLRHSIDPSFNREGVTIDELRVEVDAMLLELQSRYGPEGELLGQTAPRYLLYTPRPAS